MSKNVLIYSARLFIYWIKGRCSQKKKQKKCFLMLLSCLIVKT